MKIEIVQSIHGIDVVSVDGVKSSKAVAEIVLEAVSRIETVREHEANIAPLTPEEQYDPCQGCNGLGCEAMCAAEGGVPGSDMAWGPEDGNCCPCGGTSCDGTCGNNRPPF
jgi:hypothetical protein